ncbi:MAG TPA: SAF domain-containing protein [Acidimicrobiales bacterium]|nr:SAF domain-containing protein [Acidimicrobiales bacterium]
MKGPQQLMNNGSPTVTVPPAAPGGGPGLGTATAPTGRGARRAVPVPATPSGLPTRRRWGRVALGAVLALFGAWLAMVLVATAGGRTETLALAADVARGEVIERSDLAVVRVAADDGVETIAADDIDSVVGEVAATDLPEGALLAPGQLLADGERLVAANEVVVGVRLSASAAPRGDVASGTPILVVVRPASGADGEPPTEVAGWLRDLGEPLENTGAREASLVVPENAAGLVASAAADERIAVATREDTG